MKQLMGNLVSDIKSIQGITKMLITRASIMNNDMIRIDTSVSSALNLSPDLVISAIFIGGSLNTLAEVKFSGLL